MWSISQLRHCALVLLPAIASAASFNASVRLLSDSFSPEPVFENTNLVRNVNLERSYPRETTNIIVKNVDSKLQSEYYYLFSADEVLNVGGFEVKDKKNPDGDSFKVELAQHTSANPNAYYIITFPEPLKPSATITISVAYNLLSSVKPLPAQIDQSGQQTITYAFSAKLPSAYLATNQKTKLKLPTGNLAEFTKLPEKNAEGASDPINQGSTLTYGPYTDVKPGTRVPVSVRYEFTKPLLHASLMERDIEVSQWGGNLAVEERYWLTNRAAKLKSHFSRVQYQMSQYANPPTTAAREIRLPLLGGSTNPYYTDDIGNVSTSRFRPGRRESLFDIKPRYPIYGGWNYSFRVGWDAELKKFLRRVKGEQYVLKVPFMEGPKTVEGIEYEKVVVRVVLPEGAKNIQFTAPVPYSASAITIRKTFMDTIGRPTLVLEARNAVEEWRDRGDIIVTYDYPWIAGFRKPMTIAAAMFAVFFTAWIVGNLDVRIGKKR